MTIYDDIKQPKVIFDTESELSGHIQVYQVGKTRKLIVQGIDQSMAIDAPSCNSLVWGKAVELLKREEPNLKRILILGLGGGTMAHLISKAFDSPEIVGVEIDSVIVDVAKKYFDLDKIPNLKIIVEDALKVVVEPEKHDLEISSFQALIVDIFCGEKYPDLGKSGNFIAAIKKLVCSGGLLIFNRIYTQEHQDEVNLFIDQLEEFLGDVDSETIAGQTNSDNILIYGKA